MSPASNEEPGQPLPRRLRSLRVPMLIAAFALVAAWALLQGQAKVLESMAPAGCTSGGPAVIQGGPGMATDSDVVEIVTGWHAFTRVTHGDVIERMSTDCVSVPATPSTTERVLKIRNADTTARVWMITDMIFFAPAYGVLLLLVLEWVRRLPDPTIRPATARARVRPEDPVLRAAIWLAGKKRTMTLLVVAGVACDWTENALMLRRLSSWWNVLDETGQLHTDDLGIALLRRFGIVKWAFLLLPIVVALVLAMRQVIRAAILLGRALPRVWVQIVLVAVFSIGVLMPDQGADALRRLSLWQWVPTLCLLGLFVVVIVLTAGEALKPLAPVVVPVRPASADPSTTTASVPPEPVRPNVRPVPAIALVFFVAAAFVSGVMWLLIPALAVVVWTAWPKRMLVVRGARASAWAWGVVAVGGAIALVSAITGFRGLIIPALIIAVVGAISVVLDVVYEFSAKKVGDDEPPPETAEAKHRRENQIIAVGRVAPCLGGVIVAAFGFATLRATAGDFALIGMGPGGRLFWRQLIGFTLTVASGLIVLLCRRMLRNAARWSDRTRLVVLVILAAAYTPAILLHDPDVNLAVSAGIGTFGLIAIFLSGFSLIGSMAARMSNAMMRQHTISRIALPSALRLMRFKSTPVMGMLVLWAVLVGIVDHHEYHAVREHDAGSTTALTVDQYAAKWTARQPAGDDASAALLVASSGGGIRAAYWTAAVLDCVIERTGPADDPCRDAADATTIAARRQALLTMSGISGGSLGLAEYVVAVGDAWTDPATATALPDRWYHARLGDDFLAPTVTGWLFNDGANALLRPTQGVDRAAILERAWERSWPGRDLAGDFLAGQTTGNEPALLLNGFSVEDGCRVLTSGLVTQPARSASECGKTFDSTPEPAVLSTADLDAQLCQGRDINYSTAALSSARFPFVSPAGHLPGCDGGSPIEIVDGGYRETSAASTIDELWPELDTALKSSSPRCVAPIFLQIDNGYASDQVSGVGRGTVRQTLAPLKAVMNASSGEEAAAREQSQQLFDGVDGGRWFRVTTYAHPGSAAPLGWVLSSDAMNDLENQLKVNGDTIAAIHAALDTPTPCS